ncbi:Similar to Complex I intermediate-associated protein 84, mitochondrial; acc. no. O42637 [Pyronema omphalodes CBS 100304]|uniref:Similar to Complex I intermediate-associated protein 84, mitochondrial acc. no. O42637 n=1 Tax=Pyronema omphalodes (strain CBS 100304) TaxID=1076935 RepID=U4LU52_PYROM|nr:Similar to Complex I intermediate-associated protein 84, mitochondrial; acc. no. O42637 [Pyronema omphalodes CBS 100304]
MRPLLRLRPLLRRPSPARLLHTTVPLRYAATNQDGQSGYFSRLWTNKQVVERPEQLGGIKFLKALEIYQEKKIGLRPDVNATTRAINDTWSWWKKEKPIGMSEETAALLLKGWLFLRELLDDQARQAIMDGEKFTRATTTMPRPMLLQGLRAFREGTESQVKLARMILYELQQDQENKLRNWELTDYYKCMVQAGHTLEALEVLQRYDDDVTQADENWGIVLDGLVNERRDKELVEAMKYLMPRKSFHDRAKMYSYPVKAFIELKDMENVEKWYKLAGQDCSPQDMIPLHETVLRACLKKNAIEFGEQILDTLIPQLITALDNKAATNKNAWATAIQFISLISNDMATKLLKKLDRENGDRTDVFNLLFENVISSDRKDDIEFYNSKEYFETNIGPDGLYGNYHTLELRILAYMKLQNFPAAESAWRSLAIGTHELPKEYTAEIPQQLLGALARRPDTSSSVLCKFFDDLLEIGCKIIVPDTLTPTLGHAPKRQNLQYAHKLLNSSVGHYPQLARQRCIGVLSYHCTDTQKSAIENWEIYLLLVRSFAETDIRQRQAVMWFFYKIQRPDMAARVLEHAADTDDHKPDNIAYTIAFHGVSMTHSPGTMDRIMKLFNMDARLEPDTRMLNAMMTAWSYCGVHKRAWEVYDRIERSVEGPTASTVAQAFDLAGRTRYVGLKRLRYLWDKYKDMELNDQHHSSYVEALGRHGQWDEARDFVGNIKNPGKRVLTTLHSTFRRDRLGELETWLSTTFPDQWSEISSTVRRDRIATSYHYDVDVRKEVRPTEPQPTTASVSGSPVPAQSMTEDQRQAEKAKLLLDEEEMDTTHIRKSAGFDEAKAKRDREAWEKARSLEQKGLEELIGKKEVQETKEVKKGHQKKRTELEEESILMGWGA